MIGDAERDSGARCCGVLLLIMIICDLCVFQNVCYKMCVTKCVQKLLKVSSENRLDEVDPGA